jgi:DNA repair exonuclease SbcCD ATPase subunit
MTPKDEIREEAEIPYTEILEAFRDWRNKYGKYASRCEAFKSGCKFGVNSTHSQLKEQQEVRYDEEGNVVEENRKCYEVGYGVGSGKRKCGREGCDNIWRINDEAPICKAKNGKTAQQLIKEQQEEIERLRGCKITQRQSDRIEQLKAETKDLDSQLTASMELVRKRYDELQAKQKEVDELRDGHKFLEDACVEAEEVIRDCGGVVPQSIIDANRNNF